MSQQLTRNKTSQRTETLELRVVSGALPRRALGMGPCCGSAVGCTGQSLRAARWSAQTSQKAKAKVTHLEDEILVGRVAGEETLHECDAYGARPKVSEAAPVKDSWKSGYRQYTEHRKRKTGAIKNYHNYSNNIL